MFLTGRESVVCRIGGGTVRICSLFSGKRLGQARKLIQTLSLLLTLVSS